MTGLNAFTLPSRRMFLPLLIFVVIAFVLTSFVIGRSIGKAFCTVNDTAYQVFADNIDNLKAVFPPVSSPTTITATRLSVPGKGREYVVRAYYGSAPDAPFPILYIPLLEAGESLTTGVYGYLYASDVNAFWNANYKLTELSEHIYCYDAR